MHNHNEILFTPEQIDEQIDRMAAIADQQKGQRAALIYDLQTVSREYVQTRDRVWSHLSDRLASSTEVSSEGIIQGIFAGSEKAASVSKRQTVAARPKVFRGAVSPLARMVAGLVVVVLVGSMLWGFGIMRREQSAAPSQAQLPQGTPVAQLYCPTNTSDLGLPAICRLHEAQLINQSKSFGKQTLTLQAAYADANRVILWFRLTPPDFPTPVHNSRTSVVPHPEFELMEGSTLTTAQGTQLPAWEEGTIGSASPTQAIDSYVTFDATSVPASVQMLKFHLVMKVPSISSHPSYHSSYDFSVPMQKSLRIDTNQTVTVSGIPVTLQRVVVSPSEVRFFLASPVLHSIGGNTEQDNYKLTTSNRAWNLQDHALYGTNLDTRNGIHTYQLDLYESILNAKGMWTLTISKDEVKRATSDWVFHFRVG